MTDDFDKKVQLIEEEKMTAVREKKQTIQDILPKMKNCMIAVKEQ